MRDQVRFSTQLFSLPETQNQNGVALAKWICTTLPAHLKPDFLDEDWGCRIFFDNPDFVKIFLGCSHVEKNQWSIAAFFNQSLVEKLLRKRPPQEKLAELVRALDLAVANEQNFSEVEWFENKGHIEQNHAPRAFD